MMEIRQYQTADHAAVWELHQVVLQRVGADLGDGSWADDLHQVEQVYLSNRGEFLVGFHDTRLMAMGGLRHTTDERAEITRMRVHPDVQGRGFGQLILTALQARAVELGYTTLHLDTSPAAMAAQRLYRKNGFRQLSETREVRGLTQIFFEKSLSV